MSANKPRVELWDYINAYTMSCGGDPNKRIYGNTLRQQAVSAVEGAVDAEVSRLQAELDAARRELDRCKRMLAAVRSSEFDGFSFDNVDGANWFDLRREILAPPAAEQPQAEPQEYTILDRDETGRTVYTEEPGAGDADRRGTP